MTVGSPVDPGAAYRDVRVGVIELLRTADDDALVMIAPATPEWRVRDVAGHLAGVCDDVAHGNMEGAPGPAWTGAQVDKRRDWDLEQLVTDWTEHAESLEPQMAAWGSAIGQMVFDAWTHEQDIRGALGAPGGRDSAAARIAFDWMVGNLQAPDDIDPSRPSDPAGDRGAHRSRDGRDLRSARGHRPRHASGSTGGLARTSSCGPSPGGGAGPRSPRWTGRATHSSSAWCSAIRSSLQSSTSSNRDQHALQSPRSAARAARWRRRNREACRTLGGIVSTVAYPSRTKVAFTKRPSLARCT